MYFLASNLMALTNGSLDLGELNSLDIHSLGKYCLIEKWNALLNVSRNVLSNTSVFLLLHICLCGVRL